MHLWYNPTHPQLVPTRKSSMSSKRSIDVFPYRQVYPAASIKAVPSSPSFKEQLRKSSLSLDSPQCLPTCSLSFLFIAKALVYLTVALTGIMASYRMSFLPTRVLVDSEAGLCPDIPNSHQHRKRGAHSTTFTRIFNKFNKYFIIMNKHIS